MLESASVAPLRGGRQAPPATRAASAEQHRLRGADTSRRSSSPRANSIPAASSARPPVSRYPRPTRRSSTATAPTHSAADAIVSASRPSDGTVDLDTTSTATTNGTATAACQNTLVGPISKASDSGSPSSATAATVSGSRERTMPVASESGHRPVCRQETQVDTTAIEIPSPTTTAVLPQSANALMVSPFVAR